MIEIVGIVNVTPDSFSDGDQYNTADKALQRIDTLLEEGADKIDIGAESTRPGSSEVTISEEWRRLYPVLSSLRDNNYEAWRFSIDTRHAEIARRALERWSTRLTINDVTGGLYDPAMSLVVAEADTDMVISHGPLASRGNMGEVHSQKITSIDRVHAELETVVAAAVACGVNSEKIIVDPGIGFGKSVDLNWLLVQSTSRFSDLAGRIMLGYSRKRFLGVERMRPEINTLTGRVAIDHGLREGYLRVHDVAAHRQMVDNYFR